MNCLFRPNYLKHPPSTSTTISTTTNVWGQVVSAPDTLQHSFYSCSCVDYPCVCLFFFFSYLKCHFEPVWPVRNGFETKDSVCVHRPSINLFSSVFIFILSTHLFFFWGSIPLSKVNQYGHIILSVFICRFVPYSAPPGSLWLYLEMTRFCKRPLFSIYQRS